MLVDLDHLLATSIFDPTRCSIGFHPLHSYPAIVIYIILLFNKKTRVVAIGLLMHITTDVIDCFFKESLNVNEILWQKANIIILEKPTGI